ncbi:MAG: hypothetical protein QM783_04810 [Phycisphaerales bacterium]
MKWNISKRLGLGFGAMVTLIAVLATASWHTARSTESAVDVLNRRTDEMQSAALLEQTGHRLGSRVSDYLLTPSNPESLKGVYEFKEKFEQENAKLTELCDDADRRKALDEIKTGFEAIWPDFDRVKADTNKSETLLYKTLPEAIKSVCNDLTTVVTEANAANNVAARSVLASARSRRLRRTSRFRRPSHR